MDVLASAPTAKAVPDSDTQLVERVRRGDEQAFRSLYLRHSRYIAGVVYRLMGSDGELEDIVQDTFVTASERIAKLREPEHLRRWLVTIAVRRARRRLARRRRRAWLTAEAMQGAARASDPRDRAPADELYDVLERIPERFRIPWFLARIEGETLDVVAEICEVSLATVKRRIAEAQARIDRRLQA